jgi:hypothetical protein
MKIETKPNVNWNASPFNMSNSISKEVRLNLARRFEVAINSLKYTNEYNKLLLKDGWVVTAKDNVVFILNSDKNEELADNADLGSKSFDAGALDAKLRKLRNAAWDSETYSDLSNVEGISLNPTTGKISIKVL